MAGRVPEHVVQQVLHGVDIVRLAGRYCELKRKGKKHWARCPFHEEKTPSFSVDAEKGLYYCFGCKEGGSAFTLLQKMEGMSFGEALRHLAAEAGVDLTPYEGRTGPDRTELSRLRELNELATSYYQKCLQKARGGEAARQYLAQRGISDESLDAWRMGYAPEGWEHFLKCATGRGYEPELLVKAGLALAREGAPGHYDRFRNRLMFPIGDANGRTIGFGARALEPDDQPKYLNSPETPLFSKGSCFFGLAQAKEAIRSSRTAAVMEGYTDVIMAHQHGVGEAIAVLGTALTEGHARTLSRLCERVVLVFDADEAGRRSAAKSIEVLLNHDLEIRVADLPAGTDPCDYILDRGAEEFRRRLGESKGFFEFSLRSACDAHDVGTVQGRMAALRDLQRVADVLRGGPGYDPFVQRTAEELSIRETAVRQQFDRGGAVRGTRNQEAHPVGRLSAEDSLPRELLGLLLCSPELLRQSAGRIDASQLKECAERSLLENLLAGAAKRKRADTARFVASLSDPASAAAAAQAMAEEEERQRKMEETSVEARLEGYLDYLERKRSALAATKLPADDEEFLEHVRMLRERDTRSGLSKRTQEPQPDGKE